MTYFSLSKPLRISLSAVCLSTTLMMGACGPKDKGAPPVISADKAPLGLSGLSDKDFAKHFNVPSRQTDDREAQKALAALGLTESSSVGVTWDKFSGSAGNYAFSNMKSTSDEGTISIGTAQLFGVHMEGDNATFDRADFGDISLTAEDIALKVGAMSLARPTADTAKALMKSLESFSETTNLDFGDDTKFEFGAISMKSIDITAAEVSGTIDQVVWGVDETTKRADMKLANVDFSLPQENSNIAPILTLKNLSARGVNMKGLYKSFAAGSSGSGDGLANLLAGSNAYGKPYDTIKLEALSFDSDSFNFNLPEIEAASETNGEITTITQVLAPMTLRLKDTVTGPARQAYEMLEQLGFDTMTIKSSQTTVLNEAKDTMEVKDGILDMADGFRLNYTYKASGLNAFSEAVKSEAQEAKTSDTETSDTETGPQQKALDNLRLNGVKLSLEDNSIVERGLNLAAQMRGHDTDRVKQEMRAALVVAPFLAQNDLEKDFIKKFGKAFMDFIDDGGTLTVQLAPETPIPLSAFENPETLAPESLGFTARQD